MAYWLIKSEPFKYSWDTFVREKKTCWDGVRNYQARNNLKTMGKGDLCLYYHSNEGKEIVGVARVVREAYQDPTTDDDRWVAVDLVPERALSRPVPLSVLKEDSRTKEMALVRQGRLSVGPVTDEEFVAVVDLAGE